MTADDLPGETKQPSSTCPETVRGASTWDLPRACDKPVKRNGMCGLHAAAKERSERGEAERKAKRERGSEIARNLTEALGLPVHYSGWGSDDRFTISRDAVHEWWERTHGKASS